MEDIVARVLFLALQALFEQLVPQSLQLAAREVLLALFVTAALWVWDKLRSLAHLAADSGGPRPACFGAPAA